MKASVIVQFGLSAAIIAGVASCTSRSETHFPERAFVGPWSMDAKNLERLTNGMDTVNLGDDISHVVDALGIPDLDYTVKKNEKNRFLTYYVTRQRADSPIESDKRVTIALNGHNKVKAVYSNVQGISSRNWP